MNEGAAFSPIQSVPMANLVLIRPVHRLKLCTHSVSDEGFSFAFLFS